MTVKKIRISNLRQPVLFHEGEGYMLSTFSAHEVLYEGFTFKTAEHAYQAFKFEGITSIFMDIVRARSPMEAKNIAKKHEALVRKDWELVKENLMRGILKAKLKQHKEIREFLEYNRNRELVSGEDNHLGKIWMELRQSNE